MGGGGASGEVVFANYIMDTHAYMLAGAVTDHNGNYKATEDKVSKTAVEIFNSMYTSSPYASLSVSNPTDYMTDLKSRYDLYLAAMTSYSESDYSTYITQALLAVGNSTTVPLPEMALDVSVLSTPQALVNTYNTILRTDAASNLASMYSNVEPDVVALLASAASAATASVTLTAATTLWLSLITTAKTELAKCNIPKQANLLAVLTKAAQDASANLQEAIDLAEQVINDGKLTEIVNQYSARRSITFAQQHSDFAGQMADLNAINSTGFLFGSALLKSEQMREVAEFDATLSYDGFKQGLDFYFRTHQANLQAGVQIEIANAEAHNRILEAAMQLLSTLAVRSEVKPVDLLGLYGQFFQAELAMFSQDIRGGSQTAAQLYGQNLEGVARLEQVNKAAKEARYMLGLQQMADLFKNKVEYQRVATTLLGETNRLRYVARKEYDEEIQENLIRDSMWQLDTMRALSEILGAPTGLAGTVGKGKSKASSAIGGAIAGAGLAVATGGVSIPLMAGLGGLGGLFQ